MTGVIKKTIPAVLIALCLAMTAAEAYAKDNLCGECHTAREMAAMGGMMGWDRSIYQQKDTNCPGVLELKKDAYFTESRLVRYNELLNKMEEKTRRYPEFIREDLDRFSVSYAEMGSATPASIEESTGPVLKLKKKINEVYQTINKLREDYRMEKVMGFAFLGTLLVMLLIFLGLKNTLKG